jgi:uncharacterized membrane protein YkvA (DUF1232 family)
MKPVTRPRHPLIRLAGTVARLPRYLYLAQSLARDPLVPVHHKASLALGIGYAVSPIDLIPGIVPLVGQLDDLAALLLGIRHTLRSCPPELAATHLARAGLAASALDSDVHVVKVAAVWLASRTARLGARVLGVPFRLASGAVHAARGRARSRASRVGDAAD